LGANLNANVPVDRHIFAKRVRVWTNANGFISALNADNLADFEPGPPARWRFAPNAGDGNTAEIEMTAEMLAGQNTTVLRFTRPNDAAERVPATVRLTVRVDIEDRNFHSETKHNPGAEQHFSAHTRPLPNPTGFAFTPAPDRQLRVFCDAGEFHPEPEWCENIPHPVEATRGQVATGDAYSPGWFDLSLATGATRTLVVTAEKQVSQFTSSEGSGVGSSDNAEQPNSFFVRLLTAAKAFVVRRGEG